MLGRDEFSVLIERAGLKLDDDQFEAACASYANLRVLTDLVRIPRDRRVESPHVFRVDGPAIPRPCITDDRPSTDEV